MLRKILILCAFICGCAERACPTPGKDHFSHGLSFLSTEVNQDRRTGLNLTPDKPLDFSAGGFSLEFDLKLQGKLFSYGYIVRIISDELNYFDIISYPEQQKISFILSEQHNVAAATEVQTWKTDIQTDWTHFRINFTADSIFIDAGEMERVLDRSFSRFRNIRIYFGRSRHQNSYITDVPPMTIRDVTVRDAKGNVKRNWPLSEHARNNVYDTTKGFRAEVSNGVWEIDKHTEWKQVLAMTIPEKNPEIAYDTVNGRIFIVRRNCINIYDLERGTLDTVRIAGGMRYEGVASNVLYDYSRDQLISYWPDSLELNRFDFDTRRWSSDRLIDLNRRQHHNRFIEPESDRLFAVNGYGNYRYNSLVSQIRLSGDGWWETVATDSLVYPRYLSAVGREAPGKYLILGGFGSPSGKQEESPRNYYDLYRLDTKDLSITKLWEFPNTRNHFTFGNSMMVDEAENRVYTLAYNNDRFNTHVFLARFDIATDTPSMQVVSDSLEYKFLDIKSFCDLCYYRGTGFFYGIVEQEKEPGTTSVDIWSLAYPPLPKAAVLQHTAATKTKFWPYLILISAAAAGAVVWIVSRARGRKSVNTKPISVKSETGEEAAVTKSTVYLLGGFRIFDGEGANRTGDFTPTLKQLFLYFLLNSVNSERGVTSQALDDTFWFDMDRQSALNNRSVNIRKLRLVLEKIGGITLTGRNGYWFLEIDKEYYCDYKSILRRIDKLEEGSAPYRETVEKIAVTAARGVMLPNIHAEWADGFKADFSQKLLDVLNEAMQNPDVKADNRLLLKVADAILTHDNIDEDAARAKCRLLYNAGQKGLSKQCYDKFAQDYKRLLDSEPDFTYEDIIGKN